MSCVPVQSMQRHAPAASLLTALLGLSKSSSHICVHLFACGLHDSYMSIAVIALSDHPSGQ